MSLKKAHSTADALSCYLPQSKLLLVGLGQRLQA